MSIGALLGGIARQAGGNMKENADRAYFEDQQQRELGTRLLIQHLHDYGDEMTDEEHKAAANQLTALNPGIDKALKKAGIGSLSDAFSIAKLLHPHVSPLSPHPDHPSALSPAKPTGGGSTLTGPGTPAGVSLGFPPEGQGPPSPTAALGPATLNLGEQAGAAVPEFAQMPAPPPASPTYTPRTLREAAQLRGQEELQATINQVQQMNIPQEYKDILATNILSGGKLNVTPLPAAQVRGETQRDIAGKNIESRENMVDRQIESREKIAANRQKTGQYGMTTDNEGNVYVVDKQSGTGQMVMGAKGKKTSTGATSGTYRPLLDDNGNVTEWVNTKNPDLRIPEPKNGSRVNPMSETSRTKNEQLDLMRHDMALLDTLTDQSNVQDAIGAGSGRFTNWTRGIVEKDDDVNEAFRISANLADILLRARSGAQINEQEYARLKKLVPNPETPLARFKSDLRGFARELNIALKRRGLPTVEIRGGTGTAAQAARESSSEAAAESVPPRPNKFPGFVTFMGKQFPIADGPTYDRFVAWATKRAGK